MPAAVLLLSGGLDSTTLLALAKHEGFDAGGFGPGAGSAVYQRLGWSR